MRLLVVGASGRLGSRVITAALEMGHEVTALARAPEQVGLAHPRLRLAPVDVRDRAALASHLPGHDAVVSTLGYRRHAETPDILAVGIRHLAGEMPAAGIRRLVVLASAGILQWDATRLRCERPGYPAAFMAGAAMHREVWQILEGSELDWTLVCPPELVEGPADQPLVARAGELPQAPLHVSMPALARWMVETALSANWLRQRVGVIDAPATE